VCETCDSLSQTLNRRRLLRLSATGVGALAASGVGSRTAWQSGASAQDATPAAPTPTPAHWTYEGEEGPEHWGELDPTYEMCSAGKEQSPIDVVEPTDGDLADIAVSYQPISPMRIVNNGHTIQVNVDPGSSITLDGVQYELAQFHFHTPSEHLIAGQPQEMELHLVHKSAEGQLAVVGIMLNEGQANTALAPVFDNMPATAGAEQSVTAMLDPTTFFPAATSTYRYMGSLTTPPCTEGIHWNLLTQPVDISAEQIEAFKALFAMNARPPQGLNEREVVKDTTG
jgi:carbonic anhydrase